MTQPSPEQQTTAAEDYQAWRDLQDVLEERDREWWAMCAYHLGTGVQMLGWIHQHPVRPVAELTDADGLVAPGVVVELPQRET